MCQDDSARALWLAVLAQAFEDLRYERIGSAEYTVAASFLTDITGEWRRSREEIADLAGVLPERVRREALSVIEGRREREGEPEGQAVVVRTPPPPAAPIKPVEVVTVEQSVRAVFKPPSRPLAPLFAAETTSNGLVRPAHLAEALRARHDQLSSVDNPFNPHRRRA